MCVARACVCACAFVSVCLSVYVCLSVCVYMLCMCVCACMRVCAYVYMYIWFISCNDITVISHEIATASVTDSYSLTLVIVLLDII